MCWELSMLRSLLNINYSLAYPIPVFMKTSPSDIADDYLKYLMICSKSSDILSDHLKNFVNTETEISDVLKCLMICSSDLLCDDLKKISEIVCERRYYRQVFNIRCTLAGNKFVDNSDVVGASPVGAAPTTSPFLTYYLASIAWANKTAGWGEGHLSLVIWCVLD